MPYTKSLSILFFLILCFCKSINAQYFEQEIKKALKSEPRFIAYFDSRGSFISTNGVRVFGVKAGLQYAEKLTFGIGYNQLASRYTNYIEKEGQTKKVELKYWYISPYVEYTFYRDKQWELMIPVQIGLGESYYETNGDNKILNFQWVFSYEPAIAFQYRFLEFFGAGFGVGYRLMVVPNTQLEERFTSPVYMLKFKVYFDDLMEKLKQLN